MGVWSPHLPLALQQGKIVAQKHAWKQVRSCQATFVGEEEEEVQTPLGLAKTTGPKHAWTMEKLYPWRIFALAVVELVLRHLLRTGEKTQSPEYPYGLVGAGSVALRLLKEVRY